MLGADSSLKLRPIAAVEQYPDMLQRGPSNLPFAASASLT